MYKGRAQVSALKLNVIISYGYANDLSCNKSDVTNIVVLIFSTGVLYVNS